MRLSTVIVPTYRWAEGRQVWRRAEQLGFHAAYTYDHLSWRSFRDRDWFATVPTLTAAALVTDRIRIGTLVSSPNFRHPVTFAKELMTLDDISDGRVTVGIGAGGTGFDASALGQQVWSSRERAERYTEFVAMLDRLLTEPVLTTQGQYYAADEVRNIPGPTQQPRPPFAIAATGPKGLALAARYGQAWVTYGDPAGDPEATPEADQAAVAAQLRRLEQSCAAIGRDPGELDKVLLQGNTGERALDSLDAFVDYAGRYAELGITEIVVHWPVADSVFDTDPAVFERIALDGLAQLDRGGAVPHN